MHGVDVDAIDPVRPLAKRRVAAEPHVGDDLAHRFAHVDLAMEEPLEARRGCRVDVRRRETVALARDDDCTKRGGIEAGERDGHAAPAVRRCRGRASQRHRDGADRIVARLERGVVGDQASG